MSQLVTMDRGATTEMLAPWGIFAQRIGLVEALKGVANPQRQRDHTPQTKLTEFMVAISCGCAYLQDINQGPHPLDRDRAVAQAWGQAGWADYSGVSRTLKACNAETVVAVLRVSAFATIMVGALMGGLAAVFLQPDVVLAFVNDPSLSTPVAMLKGSWSAMATGFALDTGYEGLNNLLNRGGTASMLETMWLIISAMVFVAYWSIQACSLD